jgi:nucleotide-binding universal stress UspA family protein
MSHIQKILVPTDFSEPSFKGVEAAVELARYFGSELLLIHVVPSTHIIPPSGPPVPTGKQLSTLMNELVDSAKGSLDTTIRKRVSEDIGVHPFVLQGKPAEEIVRVADEEHVDIIVIATHGWSGWRRFIFGSVAERVVRLAECPVLTIPEVPNEG